MMLSLSSFISRPFYIFLYLSWSWTYISLTLSVSPATQIVDKITWHYNDVKLPKALSDHTATYVGRHEDNGEDDGIVIIIGGCDSPNGNERHHDYHDLFSCSSLSKSTFVYLPLDNIFKQLQDMPIPRYRHAASYDYIHDVIWIVGGRDINDNIIEQVDVYDIKMGKWSTVGKISSDYATSDLTSFFHHSSSDNSALLYVLGGYIPDYTAVGTTYTIDTNAYINANGEEDDEDDEEKENNEEEEEDLVEVNIEQKASMNVARGDIHAVSLYGYVYVSGGMTHEDQWCDVITSMERYHIKENVWINDSNVTPSMQIGRGDFALAVLNGRIFAIGGETKPKECMNDPAFASIPINDVEMYNPQQSQQWFVMEEYPNSYFRFAASSIPYMNRIYTFGGQTSYEPDCDCFPTSNAVIYHEETWVEEVVNTLGSSSSSSIKIQNNSFLQMSILQIIFICSLLYML